MIERNFDVIVVGAGHAGCEAALAAARLGMRTMVMATNLDTVAYLACNPSIGGTAKGQIVREIDALGGEMALCADSALLQMRMLNQGKGPAVYSPRAQVDKRKYHENMKKTLENQRNLYLRQAEAVNIEVNNGIFFVDTAVGLTYTAKAVVLCCGVYLNSKVIIGEYTAETGPNGFSSAKKLTESLVKLGFTVKRFKTGTPARVKRSSIDFSKTIEQKSDDYVRAFSYLSNETPIFERSCYLTYTTSETKKIIEENKSLAPLYNGGINGTGPRYCPSIEDKIIRFADKERHQIFLEPEGENTEEVYVQGASSSMPAEIQEKIYNTVDGLKNVEIMRDAYAIEYDCIDATALTPYLMSKKISGLFFAGQINGTSGYEEAAAQGLVAGINAERYVCGKEFEVFPRDNSYIGVLIDDITTKESDEPYRMMTSRAEHRLVLRQDNADLRLTERGRAIGLVGDERYDKFLKKKKNIAAAEKELGKMFSPVQIKDLFEELGETVPKNGLTLFDLLKRPKLSAAELNKRFKVFENIPYDAVYDTEVNVKYKGYIDKQLALIEQARKLESKTLPHDIDYLKIDGLRIEARQKLEKIRPLNLGQAGRISGVSPADIQILIVYLAQREAKCLIL